MKLRADLHLHTDPNHGIPPIDLAKRVHEQPLDIIAVTDHRIVSPRTLVVREELERLSGITGKRAAIVIHGIEGALRFQNGGKKKGFYHFIHLFQQRYGEGDQLPERFQHGGSEYDLDQYKEDHKGVTIGVHLNWKDGKENQPEMTEDLMRSGLFDGIELISGATLGFLQRNGGNGECKRTVLSIIELLSMFQRVRDSLEKEGISLAPLGDSDGHFADIVGNVFTEFGGKSGLDIFRRIRSANTRAIIDTRPPKEIRDHIRRNGLNKYVEVA